jgi:hypothetical protein
MLQVDGYEYERNTTCVTCGHVMDGNRGVGLISHDMEEGDISLLCGWADHTMKDYLLVCLSTVMDRFPADYFPKSLMPGRTVRRESDGSWILEQ